MICDALTENDQKADENRRQRAHAQLERLTLLDQLAILAPEAIGANASVSEARVLIDTPATVQAGIVDALVFVHASLVVRRGDPSLPAPATQKVTMSQAIVSEISEIGNAVIPTCNRTRSRGRYTRRDPDK